MTTIILRHIVPVKPVLLSTGPDKKDETRVKMSWGEPKERHLEILQGAFSKAEAFYLVLHLPRNALIRCSERKLKNKNPKRKERKKKVKTQSKRKLEQNWVATFMIKLPLGRQSRSKRQTAHYRMKLRNRC